MAGRKPQPAGGQAPVVQRVRLRYAKRGPLRFTSHRDFARAFERAIHRAGVPIAYSQGFTPHPKISYASAAPTGVASEAEYLEIGLQAATEPGVVRESRDAALSSSDRPLRSASLEDDRLVARRGTAIRSATDAASCAVSAASWAMAVPQPCPSTTTCRIPVGGRGARRASRAAWGRAASSGSPGPASTARSITSWLVGKRVWTTPASSAKDR